MRTGAKAFTLVESLVSIAILGLLMSILLPSLGAAREAGRRVVCLSNQRQLTTALSMYLNDNAEWFPPATRGQFSYTPLEPNGDDAVFNWDYTVVRSSDATTFRPGVLWGEGTTPEIQQCPSLLDASANYAVGGSEEPFTGYNYNTSFLGGPTEPVGGWAFTAKGAAPPTARLSEVLDPSSCAAFGDGGFAGGSNKFMRSPFAGPRDTDIAGPTLLVDTATRAAGAQAFRHGGGTTVASFVGGHARVFGTMHRESTPASSSALGEEVGFLSIDNRMYDMDF
ncbi:MAG: type II secretion system protein [Planctomycetota bacterium]